MFGIMKFFLEILSCQIPGILVIREITVKTVSGGIGKQPEILGPIAQPGGSADNPIQILCQFIAQILFPQLTKTKNHTLVFGIVSA